MAVVKGSGADIAKAREEELKAELATDLGNAKQLMQQELSEILTDPAVLPELRAKLKDIQSKLKWRVWAVAIARLLWLPDSPANPSR